MKNEQKTVDLKLWKLSWPLCIQLLLTYSIVLSDSFFLGKISDNHAASVGAIFPIYCICYMIFTRMGHAGCSVSSQYIGAKKINMITPSYMTSVLNLLVIGVFISLGMFLFAGEIGKWIGLSHENNQITFQYIRITGSALFLEALHSAYGGILSSRGQTRWNMIGGIMYNLVNICFNYLFLTGSLGFPRWGLSGVALATVISQVSVMAFYIVVVHGREKIVFTCRELRGKFFTLYRQVMNIGIPSSIEPVSVQIVAVVVTFFIVKLGMDMMAAKTYTYNLLSLIIAFSVGIGIGTMIIVAHTVGAKDFKKADRQLHKSILLSSIVIFLVVLSLYIFSDFIFGIFTSNRIILKTAKNLLLISLFWEVVRAINIIVQSSLAAAGDARFNAFAGIILMWTVGVPLCYFIGIFLGFGLEGIWFALFLDEVIRGIVYYWRWRKRKWEKTGVLAKEGKEELAAKNAGI